MKNLLRTLLLIPLLAFALQAQLLPTTCQQAPGAAATFIKTVLAGVTYHGICVDGTVYQLYPSSVVGPAAVGGSQLAANTLAGNTALQVCHARYDFAVDGGAVTTITPATNCTIPINSLIYQTIINPTATTVGSTGNISFGLSAGGAGAAALLANTARASLSTGSVFQGIPVQSATGANSTFIKMSAAGSVTITIATNALTAGVVEVYVFYYVSST